jgi:carbamoyltransferase
MSLIRLLDDGTFELDLTYFDYYLFDKQATMYSSQMINLLGRPRKRKEPIEETHIQIAAALQRVFEEAATHLLVHLRKQTNTAKVVLAGGGFMNSVFNGKIVGKGIFDDVFISSCPDDSGTSVGAALYLYHTILGNTDRKLQRHNFWGPEYSDSEIRNILEKYKVFRMYHQDIEKVAAKLIAEGKLVGWFQGKMEFGQRALGNRSILANPCMAEMKDIVNKAVKYREDFRPFAPAILEEHTEEYFDVAEGTRVPYMEKVFPIKNDKRKKIPAVVHVDGSGRLQTVSRSTNAKFYNVINHFFEITGIPIVLNTSFNLNGEPIVCTPTDAIRTFFSCGLDCLAIGNYLVEKAAAK